MRTRLAAFASTRGTYAVTVAGVLLLLLARPLAQAPAAGDLEREARAINDELRDLD